MRKEGKQTKKNKTLWEISFRHAFYLVRVVRTYCVPIATYRLLYLGDAQVKRNVRKH